MKSLIIEHTCPRLQQVVWPLLLVESQTYGVKSLCENYKPYKPLEGVSH